MNKKIILVLILFLLIVNITNIYAFDKVKNIKSYCVYDLNSNRFLACPNPDKKIYPASITKLAVAMLAYDFFSEDIDITVGNEIDETPQQSSLMGLNKGEKVSFSDLMAGFIIASGNDAGIVLATNIARKKTNDQSLTYSQSLPVFKKLLANKLKELGVKNTNFTNPHGYYDANHYTTAHDLVKISLATLKYPRIVELAKLKLYKSKNNRYSFKSHNEYLINNNYARGLKTGFVGESGYNLMGLAHIDEKRNLLFLVYGAENEYYRLQAANLITDTYIKNYQYRDLKLKSEFLVSNVDLNSMTTLKINYSLAGLVLANKELENLKIEYNFNPLLIKQLNNSLEINRDLYANEKIGTVKVAIGSENIKVVDMILEQDVLKNNLFRTIKYYFFRYWYGLLLILALIIIIIVKKARVNKRDYVI